MRPIALLGNLEIITSLAKSLAAEVHADLADAQGESGLARAEGVEKALSEAGEAVAAAVQVALLGAGERAAALRKQVQDAAVARVLQMLSTGALSLADLGVQVAPAMKAAPATVPVPVPTVAPASEVVAAAAPASTPVLVPTQPLTAPYKNPVKFFDPASGAGWSGRGPLPKWLAALLVDGKTLEDFRVGAQPAASSGAAVTQPVASSEASAQAAAAVANEAAEATPVAETAQTAATGGDAEGDASFDAGPAEAPEAQEAVGFAVAVAVAADAGDAPAASLDIGDAVSFDVANFDDVVMPKAPAADDGMGEFIEFFATMPGALHQTPAAPAL